MKTGKYIVYCPELNVYGADVLTGLTETSDIELSYWWNSFELAVAEAGRLECDHKNMYVFNVYEVEISTYLGKKVG